jgi:hypothetical protein
MSWNTLETTDVINQMTAAEVAALENITSDQLEAIVTIAVNGARSSIKAGGNQVDQTGATVPDALRQSIIDITRWKWLSSFPALKAFKTEDREKAHDKAQTRLEKIAGQDPKRERTELPANADTTPAPIDGTQVASSTRRKAKARDFNGLI